MYLTTCEIIGIWCTIVLLFVFIFELLYLYALPLVRIIFCKVGDVYVKKFKLDNPFDVRLKVRETYKIVDIKGLYVKYENYEVYRYNDSDEEYVAHKMTSSCNIYAFFAFIIYNFKKEKK
jgi:hypothetical protein